MLNYCVYFNHFVIDIQTVIIFLMLCTRCITNRVHPIGIFVTRMTKKPHEHKNKAGKTRSTPEVRKGVKKSSKPVLRKKRVTEIVKMVKGLQLG